MEISVNSSNHALPPLRIKYKNWKGSIGIRKIVPDYVWFGVTQFHQNPQWLIHALDVEKQEYRDFAIVDIIKFIKE